MKLIYGFSIPKQIVENELFELDVYALDDKYLYGILGKENEFNYFILDENIGNLFKTPPDLELHREEIESILLNWLKVYEELTNNLSLEELEILCLPEKLEFNWYMVNEREC